MDASDIRRLIEISGLSNREAGEVLDEDERLIRRWKSGEETPSQKKSNRLVALGAETLAGELIRALEVAAAGRVEFAKLSLDPERVDLGGIERLGPATQLKLRAEVLDCLIRRGLTIETDES